MKRLLLPILALILIACSSDDDISNSDSNGNDQENNLKLVKFEVESITFGSESTSVIDYIYNSSGNIITTIETHTSGSDDPEVITNYYEYENGKLSKIEYSEEEYSTFIYEENQIIEAYNFSEEETIKSEFEYDVNGNVITQIRTVDGEYCCTYEFEYDSNGNLLQDLGGFTYDYDNMNNPINLAFNQPYLKINKIPNNNVLVKKNQDGEIVEERTYEYNSDGFPITTEINYGSQNNTSLINYTYE